MTTNELNKLKAITKALVKDYKEEILEERDWFYNLDDFTLNVCDYDGQGVFGVTAYHVEDNTTVWDKYIELDPITEKDLLKL